MSLDQLLAELHAIRNALGGAVPVTVAGQGVLWRVAVEDGDVVLTGLEATVAPGGDEGTVVVDIINLP